MRKYNINVNVIQVIENLFDKAQSAVLFNGSTGDWYITTIEVRRNIFSERIMCEALDAQEGSVSIDGRLITNFHFADDIVVNAVEEEEADVLVERLDSSTTGFKVEIGPHKF